MKIIFVHHGEKEKAKEDPNLTPFGRKLARRAAFWIREQGIVPENIASTSTKRTIQTAQAIQKEFHEQKLSIALKNIPDSWSDWLCFGEELFRASPNPWVLVGHHPTIAMFKEEFRLKISLVTFASVIVLKRDKANHWSFIKQKQGALSL
ncbi:MAG: histidine phosphatase family protein [Myxococcota bacterium]|nr:histidine phosphatase family protein [Myxococcota bacterium]